MKIASIPVNSTVNFESLKELGVEGVYICATTSSGKDDKFIENYEGARNAGMKVGFYHSYSASKRSLMINASAREGRVFAAVVKGKSYDLPFCLDIVSKNMESIRLRNGINCWAQYVDKILNKPPIRNTDKLVLRGYPVSLEVADQDEDNDCYKRWVLGYEAYPRAVVKQIDCTGDDVVISEGILVEE